METKLPVELYQDMYARLLQLGNEKIVELYLSLEAGQSAIVLNYLKKGLHKEKAALQTNVRKLRLARRKKLRKRFRNVS